MVEERSRLQPRRRDPQRQRRRRHRRPAGPAQRIDYIADLGVTFHVNVADQRADPDSMLNFIRGLIFRYRQHPEIGWGISTVIEQRDHCVLVLRCQWESRALISVHNFAGAGTTVRFVVEDIEPGSVFVDVFAQESVPILENGEVELDLDAYGYRWLRLQGPHDRRLY